jgi:ParB family chromosome partitioning protein
MITGDPTSPDRVRRGRWTRLAESLRPVASSSRPRPVGRGAGLYVILVGERRWRAASSPDCRLLCVIVEKEIPAEERLMIQLVENALREDLRPVEQARAYRALMDTQGWSGNRLANELHIGQASVVRALALLDLPGEVQAMVDGGDLAPSAAAEIAKLSTVDQVVVAEMAVDRKLTRDEAAELVKAVRARKPAPPPKPDPVVLDVAECVVTVKWRKAGPTSALQALRKAIKELQDRERVEAEAA